MVESACHRSDSSYCWNYCGISRLLLFSSTWYYRSHSEWEMGTTPTISFYSNAFCTKFMHHITADSRYGARLVFSSLGVIGNYPCFWGTCMGNEGAFDRTHSSNHPSVVDCFLAGCASLYYTTCRVAREKRSYCRLENFSSVFRS